MSDQTALNVKFTQGVLLYYLWAWDCSGLQAKYLLGKREWSRSDGAKDVRRKEMIL